MTLKSSKFVVALILLVPIGLVAGPVLWAGMRSEIAHWYLAAAANSLQLGKGNADESIAAARTWEPELNKLNDYWKVRLRQLKTKSEFRLEDLLEEVPEEHKREIAADLAIHFRDTGDFELASGVMRVLLGEQANESILYWDIKISQTIEQESAEKAILLLREAKEANPKNGVLALKFAQDFADLQDFTSSLEAYKIWVGENYDRDVFTLNLLAYSRSLANAELDEALVDINEALDYKPEDAELRDTRGWILYGLGRYEEALVDAEFAIKAKDAASLTNWLQSLSFSAEAKSTKLPQQTFPPQNGPEQIDVPGWNYNHPPVVMLDPPRKYLKPSDVSVLQWSRGVLRYHRAKILEKLGRTDEAAIDWEWLEKNNLPPDDRLH